MRSACHAENLRTAKPNDAGHLSDLYAEIFRKQWPRKDLEERLKRKDSICYILDPEDPGELFGYLLAVNLIDSVEILSMGVTETRRCQGWAQRLMDRIVKDSTQSGISEIVLEVSETNAAARGFYRKNGFVPVGRRPGYYRIEQSNGQFQRVDALILKRSV